MWVFKTSSIWSSWYNKTLTAEAAEITITDGAAAHHRKMKPAHCVEHLIPDHFNEAFHLAYKMVQKPVPVSEVSNAACSSSLSLELLKIKAHCNQGQNRQWLQRRELHFRTHLFILTIWDCKCRNNARKSEFSPGNENATHKNFALRSQQFKLQGEWDVSDNSLVYASQYTVN